MKPSNRMRLTACCLVAAALALGASSTLAGVAVPDGWTFRFPTGDSSAGRVTYERMECAACHTKAGAETTARGTSGTGPDLSGYVGLPREYLAEAIITSHTVVAAPGYVVRDGKAGMGNYNHFMTVQELTDLVEFLRGPEQSK